MKVEARQVPWQGRRRAATFTAIALSLAACSSPALGPDGPTGILEISVMRGPIDPVEVEGRPNEAPVQGARIALHADNGNVRHRSSSDAQGIVRFRVNAGRWTAVVETCPGALDLPSSQSVEVVANATATTRFGCDTGIR